jgi:hypothetical protein
MGMPRATIDSPAEITAEKVLKAPLQKTSADF